LLSSVNTSPCSALFFPVEGFSAPNVINAEKISELQRFSGVYSGKCGILAPFASLLSVQYSWLRPCEQAHRQSRDPVVHAKHASLDEPVIKVLNLPSSFGLVDVVAAFLNGSPWPARLEWLSGEWREASRTQAIISSSMN
jgi:hypothetical protein